MQSKLFCSVSERYNPIIEMPNKPVPPGKKRKAHFVPLSFNVNKFKYTFNKPPIYKTSPLNTLRKISVISIMCLIEKFY